MRRPLGLLAAAVLGGGIALLPSVASAAVAPVSSCSSSSGTIVAVDFSHWSGPVVAGCDLGKPQTGAQLLGDEGFTLAGDEHDGPAFVCRIGNPAWSGGAQYPTPAQDPCIVTPPASAYWSYWLAAPGSNTWTYSQWGAYSTQQAPASGGIQLWIFGGTSASDANGNNVTSGRPVCSPDAVRNGTAGTCTAGSGSGSAGSGSGSGGSGSTGSGSGSGGSGSGGSGSGSSTRTGSGTGVGTRTTAAAPGGGVTSSSSAAGSPVVPSGASSGAAAGAMLSEASSCAPSSGSASGPGGEPSSSEPCSPGARRVVQATSESKHTDTGSVMPVVLGLGIIAALGAGGGFAVWRRRRTVE